MRYFLPVFLFIGFVATLGCGKRSATGIAVDPAFARLTQSDTKVLAGVRIDQLKATPLYKRHQSQLDIPMLDAFSERVGIDPRRDLSDLLIAWNGKRPVVMARGGFATPNAQKLDSLGAPPKPYKNYTLFGNGTASLVFLKKGLALSGSPEALRGVIDLNDAGGGEVPGELKQRLSALPKSDQIWAVSRGGLPFAEMPMRSDIGSALSNIVAFVSGAALGVGVDTGTHLQLEISCISNPGAERVRDALRGAIGLGRVMAKDNEVDLMRVYDSIRVDQEGQAVHVRADFPEDLTDKLLAYLPKVGGRAAQ